MVSASIASSRARARASFTRRALRPAEPIASTEHEAGITTLTTRPQQGGKGARLRASTEVDVLKPYPGPVTVRRCSCCCGRVRGPASGGAPSRTCWCDSVAVEAGAIVLDALTGVARRLREADERLAVVLPILVVVAVRVAQPLVP